MKLSNSKVSLIESKISSTYSEVENQLYQVYKALQILTQTNSFKGQGAEAVKSFMKSNSLNMTYLIVEAVKKLDDCVKQVKSGFLDLESEETGKIYDKKVDQDITEINKIANNTAELVSGLKKWENRANEFITVENSRTDELALAFDSIKQMLENVNKAFVEKDQELCNIVGALTETFGGLNNSMSQVMDHYVLPSGRYDDSKFGSLTGEEWYIQGTESVFKKKFIEDPFIYKAGNVAVAETQYAIGYANDLYAYAGGDFLSANGTMSVQDGELHAQGKARVAGGELHAKAGNLVNVSGTVDVLAASTDNRLGKNGIILSADATTARAKVDTNVGLLNANATAYGPQASGTIARYSSEEKTQIGFSGKASVGGVNYSANIGGLAVKYKADGAEKSENLIGIGGGVSAKGGVDATLMYTSEKVKDINDRISIYSNKLEIGATLGLGFSLNVSVPSVKIKLW